MVYTLVYMMHDGEFHMYKLFWMVYLMFRDIWMKIKVHFLFKQTPKNGQASTQKKLSFDFQNDPKRNLLLYC